jgi:transposase
MNEYIGIDVSKASLQCYIPAENEDIEIDNSKGGLSKLNRRLQRCRKQGKEPILIFEPTGGYSVALKKFCASRAVQCFIVNPRQSANFLKALGERNKTDKVDARMLSQMHVLAGKGEIAVPVIDVLAEQIKERMGYYKLIQKQRVTMQNHLEAAKAKQSDAFIIKRLEKEVKRLKQEEQALIDSLLELIRENPSMQRKFESITSFKGIGPLAGLALLHLFLSYPDANRKQITALCGLDVVVAESGTSLRRKGRISKKGSKLYRGTLFMATMISIQHNPKMRAFYERLKENGKHSTAAQIAVMRKMILIAHSLFKNESIYDLDHQRYRCSDLS